MYLQRGAVEELLIDEYNNLKSDPYHEIIHSLINNIHIKKTEYEKAISRAIEKEGCNSFNLLNNCLHY